MHHNDYHYRFYHYLGASGGGAEEGTVMSLAAMLVSEAKSLPESVARAFKHWSEISRKLRDLFERAPREAITDPEAALARMAIEAVGKGAYLAEIAAEIRERANALVGRCAERDKARIEAALAEPTRLLGELDTFITALVKPKEGISMWDAEIQVRKFLENCQKFDQALSAIPARLRGMAPADADKGGAEHDGG